jgi:hypothetical protein
VKEPEDPVVFRLVPVDRIGRLEQRIVRFNSTKEGIGRLPAIDFGQRWLLQRSIRI